MHSQFEKAKLFRALHERPGAFIIPNPWDAGTAKLLAATGFEALATTSLGLANMLGRGTVSIEMILQNCREIVAATELPVSVDLENCGADAPGLAAEAIRLAAEAGAVGGSLIAASCASFFALSTMCSSPAAVSRRDSRSDSAMSRVPIRTG